MKKSFLLLAISILALCACGKSAATWQEQYDMGLHYLSEGNYAEAILAFTAAIELDPERAPAYVGRGDAYVLSGETEDNLAAAQADYEKAIELDGTSAAAYLGLADVYIRRGEYDKALEILKQGLEKTGENQELADKLAEAENKSKPVEKEKDTTEKTEQDVLVPIVRQTVYEPNGTIHTILEYSYDSQGRKTEKLKYEWISDGHRAGSGEGEITLTDSETWEYDDINRIVTHITKRWNQEAENQTGILSAHWEQRLKDPAQDILGLTQSGSKHESGIFSALVTPYEQADENGLVQRSNTYWEKKENSGWDYAVYHYDETGLVVRIDTYNEGGQLTGYTELEYLT